MKTLVNSLNSSKSLIFIDEVGFEIGLSRGFAFAPFNQPAIKSIQRKPEKLNCIMAISFNKILAYQFVKTNFNKFLFIQFIENLCEKLLSSKQNNNGKITLIYDIAKFHYNKICNDLNSILPLDVLVNSPQSPQYNVIETVFAEIKRLVKCGTFSNLYFFPYIMYLERN